jgi:hypothetical protein
MRVTAACAMRARASTFQVSRAWRTAPKSPLENCKSMPHRSFDQRPFILSLSLSSIICHCVFKRFQPRVLVRAK